jgi:hypothetical protein
LRGAEIELSLVRDRAVDHERERLAAEIAASMMTRLAERKTASTTTDSQGRFSLKADGQGDYIVHVQNSAENVLWFEKINASNAVGGFVQLDNSNARKASSLHDLLIGEPGNF